MRVDIHRCDDWIAVYVDKVKKYEGHSIQPSDLLSTLGISHNNVYFEGDPTFAPIEEWFPERLDN